MSGEELYPREEFPGIENAPQWLLGVKTRLEAKFGKHEDIELAIQWFTDLSNQIVELMQLEVEIEDDKLAYFKRKTQWLELSEKNIALFAELYRLRVKFWEKHQADILIEQFEEAYLIEKR